MQSAWPWQTEGMRPAAPSRPRGNSAAATPARLISQIAEPIRIAAINRAGQQAITVHLSPPELGRVQIDVTSRSREGRDVDVVIRVERAETQRLLDQHLPALREALQSHGVDLQGLSLDVANQNPRHDQRPAESGSVFETPGGRGRVAASPNRHAPAVGRLVAAAARAGGRLNLVI